MSSDPALTTIDVPGMRVVEGWVVGTFGGRIRVWLLEDEGALAGSDAWLVHLARIFRLLPDTTAVALVEPELSCLIVQPEDCLPRIEVPRGCSSRAATGDRSNRLGKRSRRSSSS